MVWQLVVRSSSPTSSEALNVWHSDDTSAQEAADVLRLIYVAFAPVLSDDVDFDIDPVARQLNTVTGALESLAGVSWSSPVSGTAVGTRAPDATALLVSWVTDTIADGRLIRGRTFFPYPGYSVLGEGQISGGGITALDLAVSNAVAAFVGGTPAIWHRPVAGAGGAVGSVVSAFGNREYSYQGRRRN